MSYTLSLELPGISAEAVKLSLRNGGELKIVATDDAGNTILDRQLLLEPDADPTSVTSWCKDGVLEVRVKKMAPPEPAVIEVQAAEPLAVDKSTVYELLRRVPGVSAKGVDVQVESGVMRVSAKSTHQLIRNCNWHFELPEDAMVGAARAFCMHGLLTVQLPRREPEPPVDVAVTSDAEELPTNFLRLARLEVPGHGATSVCLQAEPGTLYLRLDRDGHVWERRLRLPNEVADLRRLRAVCAHGLLEIGYEPYKPQPHTVDIQVFNEKPQDMEVEASNKEGHTDVTNGAELVANNHPEDNYSHLTTK